MKPSATPLLDALRAPHLWYTATAGALLGLTSSAAHAQIVYNDIDDITVEDTDDLSDGQINAAEFFDFDGDEDPEILFVEDSEGQNTIALLNSTQGGTQPDIASAIIGNIIPYGDDNYAYFLPLEAGVTIGPDSDDWVTGYNIASFTYAGSDPNGFVGAGDVYIGVQFTLDTGNVHYGWIRVEMPADGGVLIIKDYAFNATPDEAIDTGDTGTGTANEEDALPGTHRLTNAYPNPFNPQATFNLQVRDAQNVRIGVYDLLGRQVATLFDGALAAGTDHAFTIDGAGLPSGLYLIRAVGEQFTESMTVTLAK